MANIRNWMARARELENSGDLPGAIAVYRKALVSQEETSGYADLTVYNGLGDLHLRGGEIDAAIEAYERAADQCEDQQLYANAIALCKKILRNAPGHIDAYCRVARLSALSGLEAEAHRHFDMYRERLADAGRAAEQLEALRELVEISADEEWTIELAESLDAAGRRDRALELLRSVRDRREAEGQAVVILVRKIQELQPRSVDVDVEPDATTAGVPALADAAPAAPQAVASTPADGSSPAHPPGPVATVGADAVGPPAGPLAPPPDPEDIASLTHELERTLSELEGEDRLTRALQVVDRLLEFEPGRFELLQKKLAYSFALGDQANAVSAYLALGEALDAQLEAFSLRMISSSTDSGAVTAAIKVDEVSGLGNRV